MSTHFEHDGDGGNIVLRCDNYGEFMMFMSVGRMLLNQHHFSIDAWEYIAEHGKPPAESPESEALNATKEIRAAFDNIGRVLDKHLRLGCPHGARTWHECPDCLKIASDLDTP
ncbi:MAG: hypothetical protein ACRDP5_24165 [Streptosporangiaceae bacterium]